VSSNARPNKDTALALPEKLRFEGPFPFVPPVESAWELARFSHPGVYLFTVRVGESFRVLYVGQGKSVSGRLRGHIEKYLAGNYWLYAAADLMAGKRTTAWTPGQAAEVIASKVSDLHSALRQTLPLLEVFVGVSDMSKSELCRVESALILALRESPKANEFLENHRLSIAYGDAKAELGLESDWPIFGLPPKVLV